MTEASIRGRLASDAAVHEAGQARVTRLRIIADQAPSERDRGEPVVGIDVEAWGSLGEQCAQLSQGDPVVVLGTWKTAEWVDRTSGQQRRKVYVRAYAAGPDLSRCGITGLHRPTAAATDLSQLTEQPAPAERTPDDATATARAGSRGETGSAGHNDGPIDPFDVE